MTWTDDAKLLALCALLDQVSSSDGTKVIVERLATAVYLEQALRALQPALRVASTVEVNDRPLKETALPLTENGYDFREVYFSPCFQI